MLILILWRKIVGKTKIDKEAKKAENEWVERRRREWDEHVTRMNSERSFKISRDNIPAGRGSPEPLK